MLIITAVAACIVFVFVIAFWGSGDNRDSLEFELRKAAIQFVFVGALGALVAFLIDLVKRGAERRERERDYRSTVILSILQRLDGIYRRVKHTRQHLSMRPAFSTENREHFLALRAEMEDLEELTTLIRDQALDFSELTPLVHKVHEMDVYVGRCWKEYHGWVTKQPKISDGDPFGKWLTGLVQATTTRSDPAEPVPAETTGFWKFDRTYHCVRSELSKLQVSGSPERYAV